MLRKFFGNLAVDFGLLLFLAALVALLGLIGLKRTQADYQTLINHSFEIERLAATVETDLLHAQNLEDAFMMNLEIEGFEAAQEHYLTPHGQFLDGLNADANRLGQLAAASDRPGNPQLTADVRQINADLKTYRQDFNRLVKLVKQRGTTTSGLEGDFRQKAAQVKTELTAYDEPSLQLALLQLRLATEDYLLHRTPENADQVRYWYHELVGRVDDSTVVPRRHKTTIQTLLNGYEDAFENVVDIDQEIDKLNGEIEPLFNDIEQTAVKIDDLGRQEAAAEAAHAQRLTDQTVQIVTVSALVVLIFGIGLAAAIYARMKRDNLAADSIS